MISGRKEIKDFWSGMISSMNATSAALDSIDVIFMGDGAVEIGRATLTVEPPQQAPITAEVKYVVQWKQEEGSWRWNVDIWNSNS